MKIRLFIESPLSQNQQLTLSKSQSHYLSKVLRCKTGTEIFLFNNQDGEFIGRVISTGSNVEIAISHKSRPYNTPKNITLAFAPAKNVKAEFIALKATELNIQSIQPIITEYTIVRKINSDKLRANMIEAAQQCNSVFLPKLHTCVTLTAFLNNLSPNDMLFFCDEKGLGTRALKLFPTLQYDPKKNYIILTGPEGGFSESEHNVISNYKNCYNLSLGENILRVETAIISALALFNNYYDN